MEDLTHTQPPGRTAHRRRVPPPGKPGRNGSARSSPSPNPQHPGVTRIGARTPRRPAGRRRSGYRPGEGEAETKKSHGGHGPRPPLAAACGAKAPTEGGREGRGTPHPPSQRHRGYHLSPFSPSLSLHTSRRVRGAGRPRQPRERSTPPLPAQDPNTHRQPPQGDRPALVDRHPDNPAAAGDRPPPRRTHTLNRHLDQSRCGRAHPRAPRGRGGFPRGTGPRKTGEAAVREAPT